MKKYYIGLLVAGLLSIMNLQAQRRVSRHQLDLTTGASWSLQSGASWTSSTPVPVLSFTYAYFIFPNWGIFSSMDMNLDTRPAVRHELKYPYEKDHFVQDDYGFTDETGVSYSIGLAYRLNKPVWDIQLRLGYYLKEVDEFNYSFYLKEKNTNVVRFVSYDQELAVDQSGLLGALQTSAILSRRIYRKLYFSLGVKHLLLLKRGTQTLKSINLMTKEVEDSYYKRFRRHYLEVECGISWHL